MFLQVEVSENPNCTIPLMRMFDVKGKAVLVGRVFTADSCGNDAWCDVVGWFENGPGPAYSSLVEDSGDGIAMLIHGGDHGIRLKRSDCVEPWNVASSRQWGEPCLLVDKDTHVG